ncbi:UDP-glucose--hexose-1-phosphate uridylyltransferase [Rossellomorea sp. DA94]|uniref:UDP-glucose--hexose-1-phosphate uridylyltransferase n=1 Tax=Rossellomorea sp. DA94 TaxID=3038653 RepID=UPI002448CB10|nr:UDP-glucose--hexose-1-phosphate uridylyltransferase [Rossellomorea sp. DA94]WGG45377.1 UDP-glucose--hexose-1-phosphate uridylyltransferase [Rossellomorea sp. DA94]
MDIYSMIQTLLNRGIDLGLIEECDEMYARNQLLSLLNLADFPEKVEGSVDVRIPDLLEMILQYAEDHHIVGELDAEKDILSSKLMNVLIQRPSDVNRRFYEYYEEDPKCATDYFYQLSQNSNYIQTKNIAKNINYKTETMYGDLDITINLSKPEKDPRQIALERERKHYVTYPKCLLCPENEGYEGRIGHPARSNHRVIGMTLGQEPWYLQYSPYVYYNEHCIALSKEHRNMKVTPEAFRRLLDFVHMFPHYFLGSNADLPIVGGSILSHDHYQGGNYQFAMEKAQEEFAFELRDHPDVAAATVKWPMSVIRLRSGNPDSLVDAASRVLHEWQGYSDEEVDILAFTDGTPHNTITPIARRNGEDYELDLVLRNNRTSEEHPMGIFHPHSDVHHLKKENIGLIEVMGLAVLPARLKSELEEMEKYLIGEENGLKEYHQEWADDIKARYGAGLHGENVRAVLRQELGSKFQRILEDAGVFKRNHKGREAFQKFCKLFS